MHYNMTDEEKTLLLTRYNEIGNAVDAMIDILEEDMNLSNSKYYGDSGQIFRKDNMSDDEYLLEVNKYNETMKRLEQRVLAHFAFLIEIDYPDLDINMAIRLLEYYMSLDELDYFSVVVDVGYVLDYLQTTNSVIVNK